MIDKKTNSFFLKLTNYERNIIQLQAEALGIPMSQVMTRHLKSDNFKEKYLVTIFNLDTLQTIEAVRELSATELQIDIESIGKQSYIHKDGSKWGIKEIKPYVDPKRSPIYEGTLSEKKIDSILSKINKSK
jgi:hypothetical protein